MPVISADENLVGLPVNHLFPEDVQTRFADTFVVHHTPNKFYLMFFEAEKPLMLGTPDENRAKLEALGAIDAQCVARIVVTPAGMQAMVDLMLANLERFQQRQRE